MIKLTCECGEVYHSNRQHIGKYILCKKCMNTIVVQENVPTAINSSSTTVSVQPTKAEKSITICKIRNKFREHYKVAIAVGALALLIILSSVFISNKTSYKSDPHEQPTSTARYTIETPPEPTSQPEPAREPTNPNRLPLGASPFGKGIRSGRSTLTIDNGTSTDAVVRVIRLGEPNQTVRSFFIPNDRKFTANQIPPGDYVLKVAFGNDWDNERKRFNFQRSFGKSESFDITESAWDEETDDGVIKHTRASRMSITLHKVPYGNFKTYDISEEEFLK